MKTEALTAVGSSALLALLVRLPADAMEHSTKQIACCLMGSVNKDSLDRNRHAVDGKQSRFI